MAASIKILPTHSLPADNSQPPRVRRYSTVAAGPWELVVQTVKRILIASMIVTATLLGNILTLGIPTTIRLYSEFKKQNVKEGIEALRIERLQSALKCGLTGANKWKPQPEEVPLIETLVNPTPEESDFFLKVSLLRHQVADLKPSELKGVETLYKKLQRLLRDPQFLKTYQKLESQDHPAANFLKLLAAKFRAADVSNLLVEHAKEKLGWIPPDQEEGYSIGKTGKALVDYRKNPSFKHNFLWAISHPLSWYHSCESEWLHKKYDSHAANPTYTVHQFEYITQKNQKLKARLMAGPTPFNDPVYHKIFLKEGHELRYNIMDTAKMTENDWIKRMDQAAKDSKGHLEHVVWGFATKEKRGYLKSAELNTLIDEYQKSLLEGCRTLKGPSQDNGVFISEKALTNAQIKEACRLTKSLLSQLPTDLTHKSARHAVLVAVDTMMAMGIMINYLENVQSVLQDEAIDEDMRAVYIATACKQCFDRGPVYFSALMMFFRSLNNENPFSEEEFYKITGFPLFRAPLNEGREQLQEKFVVYEQFAKMLGSNMALLSEHTRSYRRFLQKNHI